MKSVGSDLLLSLNARIAPRHTAVLVIDMQNDFCAVGGYVERIVKKDADACRRVAGPINELVATARSSGVRVFWLPPTTSWRDFRKICGRGFTSTG